MNTSYEFGQPDTIYDGPASLIVAVNAFPTRFSDDTHALVKQLVEQAIALPTAPIEA
jgi:hypothetical protein